MKNKVIILFGVFSVVVCGMILTMLPWCFDGNDVCLQKKIDSLRDVKKQLQINIDNLNKEINTLKVQFSSGYVIKEAKEGRSQNVPADLLTTSLLPQAYADTTTSLRKTPGSNTQDDTGITLSETSSLLDARLESYLRSRKAPFSSLPLLQIGKQAGLTKEETILAIAITGRESGFGKTYKHLKKGSGLVVPDFDLALSYHNAAGIKKVPGCTNQTYYPDQDGFWLAKCPSWHMFFQGYFAQLKNGYFDKGCSTAMCMRVNYVGGYEASKMGWAKAVNHFVKEIEKALN